MKEKTYSYKNNIGHKLYTPNMDFAIIRAKKYGNNSIFVDDKEVLIA